MATLELKGALTYGRPVKNLRAAVSALLARGFRRIRLDMKGVPYADASGLGALVECRKAAESHGAALSIERASRRLRDLFNLTGLRLDEPGGAPPAVPALGRRRASALRPRSGAPSLQVA